MRGAGIVMLYCRSRFSVWFVLMLQPWISVRSLRHQICALPVPAASSFVRTAERRTDLGRGVPLLAKRGLRLVIREEGPPSEPSFSLAGRVGALQNFLERSGAAALWMVCQPRAGNRCARLPRVRGHGRSNAAVLASEAGRFSVICHKNVCQPWARVTAASFTNKVRASQLPSAGLGAEWILLIHGQQFFTLCAVLSHSVQRVIRQSSEADY